MAKKKEATETVNPQLPDESKPEATTTTTPNPSPDGAADIEVELADVMGVLKQYELNSPEKVENVVKASQQTGRMAQLLGETRELNRQLEAQLKTQQTTPPNDLGFQEEQPVDLKGLIRGELNGFYDGIQQKQAEATQKQWNAYTEIQTDEDYGLVKQAWEVYIQQPNVAYSFQSGTSDPVKEYNKFVRKFQRKLLHRTKGLLEQVTQGNTIKPPFVEQGGGTPEMSRVPTELDGKLKEIKTKHKGRGSEEGMEDILDALIPADDPLLSRR